MAACSAELAGVAQPTALASGQRLQVLAADSAARHAGGPCVVPSPRLDYDPSLPQTVEDLAIEQFIAQAGVEALDIAVLQGTSRRDIGRPCADRGDLVLHGLGNKLRAIDGADIARHASQDEEIGQHVDHVDRLQPAGDPDAQTFMGIFIDHVEHEYLRPSWVRSSTKS
jgi:hypothetical protein